MNLSRKLLATFFTAVIFTFCLGSTTKASEIDVAIVRSVDEAVIEASDDNILLADEELTETETISSSLDEELEEENVIPEGMIAIIDEQGEVYYLEAPVEEPEEVEEVKKEKEVKEKPSYSEKDLRLLSALIYAEAGNQPYKGMLAVANVVLNRANSKIYWHVNTVKEVIYDNKWGAVQFSVTIKNKKTGLSILDKALNAYDTGEFPSKNQKSEEVSMKRAIKAAKAALEGENNIGDFLCFNGVNKGTASIKKKYDYKIIDGHIFYRTK
ncbi:MAG TPA: hypothetical protein GX731_01735 [Clostridiales bacterium]|nr:hypothetical protein [Clostridiales bacterium]